MTDRLRLIHADVMDGLRSLETESVHVCITSPPYWSLRDYGTGTWEGGSDPDCDHVANPAATKVFGNPEFNAGRPSRAATKTAGYYHDLCLRCGARRVDKQIGLEPDLESWLANMVEVFNEVKRVLRRDGCLWLNVGDAYASAWSCDRRNIIGNGSPDRNCKRPNRLHGGLKEKDLMLMPARLALALQQAGWWVRSDIIWAKTAPMPESCRDRPTSAHEHIFLLTKSANYFYDPVAVRTPIKESTRIRLGQATFDTQTGGPKDSGNGNRSHRKCLNNQHEKLIAQEKWKARFEGWEEWDREDGANLRNFWLLDPYSFPEAHFATFPPEIPRRAILLSTSEKGCCPHCGAGWRRVTENTPEYTAIKSSGSWKSGSPGIEFNAGQHITNRGKQVAGRETKTTGWQPGCTHECAEDELIPATVLDCFAGSGTTCLVALQLGRNAVGIELNGDYCRMAERRCAGALAQETLRL